MSFIERLRKENQEQRPTKQLEKIANDPTHTRQDRHAARTVLNERNRK